MISVPLYVVELDVCWVLCVRLSGPMCVTVRGGHTDTTTCESGPSSDAPSHCNRMSSLSPHAPL